MSFGSIILTPFAWLLLSLYNLVNNYGLALILFSLIVKIILLFFSAKSKKGMMKTSRLQPKMKELEKKHAGNKAKYNEELQKLYKENEVKPMGGCLWSLIPFPILLGLYSVIRMPLTHLMGLGQAQIDKVAGILTGLGYEATSGAYGEITMAQQIFDNFDTVRAAVPEVLNLDFSFLGLNLAATPSFSFITDSSVPFNWQTFGLFLIPLISAALSWVSTKVTTKTSGGATQGADGQPNMKGMTLMAPLMSLWIGFIMPAGLGIYWIANSVFAIIQDAVLGAYYTKILDAEDAVRLERLRKLEEERERKRIEYERLKAENATTRNKNTSKKKIQKVERIEAEKSAVEFEKKKRVDQGFESEVDNDRPFARGRAFNPQRLEETAVVKAVAEETLSAEEAAVLAEEEAKRKDDEAFEKFLETGALEETGEEMETTEEVAYDDFGEAYLSDGGDNAGDPDNK